MIDSIFGIRRNRTIAGLALAICFALMPATSQTAFNPQTAATSDTELSPQEKKVIEHLLGVWGKDHSVTSVDQAMGMGNARPDAERKTDRARDYQRRARSEAGAGDRGNRQSRRRFSKRCGTRPRDARTVSDSEA